MTFHLQVWSRSLPPVLLRPIPAADYQEATLVRVRAWYLAIESHRHTATLMTWKPNGSPFPLLFSVDGRCARLDILAVHAFAEHVSTLPSATSRNASSLYSSYGSARRGSQRGRNDKFVNNGAGGAESVGFWFLAYFSGASRHRSRAKTLEHGNFGNWI